MTDSEQSRPLDGALRARLHLAETSRFQLAAVRLSLHVMDAVSRTFVGKPFFSLRESEDLLGEVDGLTGPGLVHHILNCRGGTRITPLGLEHVPTSGPTIIASTHPTGMFDFVAHAGALFHRRPDLKVVANAETEMFLGADYIVPVSIDKQNNATSTRKTHAAMLHHLDAGGALLIFGSGRVPNAKSGRLIEPDWRSGTSRISEHCQAPIVPAAVDARNSRYYYRLRSMAQFLSGGDDNFGAMVGSLRYSSEMLEKLGGEFEVHYGAPLSPGTPSEDIKNSAECLVPGLYAGH
ncbi:1-acyl-sn-glycerol-3-phosphate acyltransferase [Rhodobacteraceae bacterium M382]|nr:1-acyl-sn-glycerol-3-phosphate acyltransferase [Rhodobacteraceae bacterium M382]